MIAAPSPLIPLRKPLPSNPSPCVQSFCRMIFAFNSSSTGYPSVEISWFLAVKMMGEVISYVCP
jgi:hypothetical protein